MILSNELRDALETQLDNITPKDAKSRAFLLEDIAKIILNDIEAFNGDLINNTYSLEHTEYESLKKIIDLIIEQHREPMVKLCNRNK